MGGVSLKKSRPHLWVEQWIYTCCISLIMSLKWCNFNNATTVCMLHMPTALIKMFGWFAHSQLSCNRHWSRHHQYWEYIHTPVTENSPVYSVGRPNIGTENRQYHSTDRTNTVGNTSTENRQHHSTDRTNTVGNTSTKNRQHHSTDRTNTISNTSTENRQHHSTDRTNTISNTSTENRQHHSTDRTNTVGNTSTENRQHHSTDRTSIVSLLFLWIPLPSLS